MREPLRFDGKINSVTISQNGNKFYASFSVEITSQEFTKTHKTTLKTQQGIGIDLGVNAFVSLSNGFMIKATKATK